MPNEETTTKLKVDITELKKSMQEAKQAANLADSEFKKVASTCDDWSKSSDGISSKLKSLNSNLDSQKAKLSLLEAQYNEVVESQGKGSKAAIDLEIKMNKQQATINKTEKEIGTLEGTLDKVTKAEKIAAKTGKDVSEVLDDMGDSAEDAEGGFTVLKGALATFAGNVMTGFAGAVKDGIMNLVSLADETREYRNEMAKLDTAFATNGHSAAAAQSTYENLYAVLGDEGQAVEAANHLSLLCDTEKDLANWTNIATGVYGQFGASLPIEGLTEAANETAKVGQVTGPLADALNWAGVSEDEFNKKLAACSSEQERQQLIMNELNGLYGDAANKFRETNSEVMEANRAQSALTDAQARLGAVAEPVITTVKQGFADLLTTVLDLVSGVDMEAFTAKIEQGFATLKDDVLPAVKEGFQWILDNKDTLIAGLAGIAGGFAAFKVASLINQAVTAFQAFKVAQEGATVAQWLMNAAMNANPIMLIVTIIAAVVAAIVTFIATNDDARAKFTEIWQGVKDFFVGVWEGICTFFTETIPNAFQSVIDWVKTNFDSLLLFLINPFAGLFDYFYDNNEKFREFVDNAIKAIKELPGKIWTWLKNTIDKVSTWASDMSTKAKDTATKFITSVIDKVKELPGKVWTWLKNVIDKVTSWASDMATKAKDAGTKFINNVVNNIKSLPGKIWTWLSNVVSKIVSWGSEMLSKGKAAATKLVTAVVTTIKTMPSKIASVGMDLVRGIGNGITKGIGWLKARIREFVGNVTDFIKRVFKIGSPSKLWRDEIGVWLARGIAVGILKGKKDVVKATEEVSEEVLEAEQFYLDESARIAAEKEEKAYQEKLASAKTAEELEKVKQERLNEIAEKEQEAYLEGLKTAAEKERKLYDKRKEEAEKLAEAIEESKQTIVDNFKDIVEDAISEVEALENLQKSISSKFKEIGNLTYQAYSFNGGEEYYLKLADVGSDNKRLRDYNELLDRLYNKRGTLPTEVANYLSEMGIEEGTKYVTALINASDEEFNKYISDLAEKTRLAEEISKKTTNTQIENLQNDLLEQFSKTVPEFFDIGEDAAVSFGGGFMFYLSNMLGDFRKHIKEDFGSIYSSDYSKIKASISSAKDSISSASASLSGGSSFVGPVPVVKNFTQNIYSPKPLSRVDIYRNSKNLLGLS